MTPENITLILSSLAALAAIICPVITALVNNHHDYKMKNLDVYSSRKFDAIENYLHCTGKLINDKHHSGFKEYDASKGLIYLYVPNSCWSYIDEIDSLIRTGEIEKTEIVFSELCKKLSKHVKKN